MKGSPRALTTSSTDASDSWRSEEAKTTNLRAYEATLEQAPRLRAERALQGALEEMRRFILEIKSRGGSSVDQYTQNEQGARNMRSTECQIYQLFLSGQHM